MYWIDVLLLVSAASLLGWLMYSLIDSIRRNDTRGLVNGICLAAAIALIVALLLVFDVLLPDDPKPPY